MSKSDLGSGEAARLPAKSIAFDRAAEYYDRTRGYPAGVAERVVDLLCRAGGLGPDSTVLEVGVGTGRIALPLAARVRRVVGVDLSRPMLARLEAKRGEERVLPLLGDALALPFADALFDAVVSVHVFHLLPAWRRALDEVRRVLAPGGLLLTAGEAQLLPELWEAAYVGVTKPENVGVAGGVTDFPCETGFRAARDPLVLRYPQRVSFAAFVRELEERVWSSSWRLDDEEHTRLCANMRAAIVARYGSLDAVLDVERELTVRAFAPD